MTYRLITVWRDEESVEPDHLQRNATDFSTHQEAEAYLLAAKDQGIIRVALNEAPLENGFNLLSVLVPIHQIVGWYIWLVPDSAPQEVAK